MVSSESQGGVPRAGRDTNVRVVLDAADRTNQVASKIAGRGSFEFEATLVMMGWVVVVFLAHVVERLGEQNHLLT